MSLKKRCPPVGCVCANDSSWKIIEANSHDIEFHKIKRSKDCPKFECSCSDNSHEIEVHKNKKSNDHSKFERELIPEKSCSCSCSNSKSFSKTFICEKEDKHHKPKRNFACLLVSVKNPDSDLIIPFTSLTGDAPNSGDASVVLSRWATDIVPDVMGVFDKITGIFTAPEDGDFQVTLIVNYRTTVALSLDPSLVNVPTIELFDVSTGERIVASQFPTLHIVVPIPPLSSGEIGTDVIVAAVIAVAQVIIDVIIPLRAGQTIAFRALSNGLTFNPFVPMATLSPARIIFDPQDADTTLTIEKVRNSPIITILCNN